MSLLACRPHLSAEMVPSSSPGASAGALRLGCLARMWPPITDTHIPHTGQALRPGQTTPDSLLTSERLVGPNRAT